MASYGIRQTMMNVFFDAKRWFIKLPPCGLMMAATSSDTVDSQNKGLIYVAIFTERHQFRHISKFVVRKHDHLFCSASFLYPSVDGINNFLFVNDTPSDVFCVAIASRHVQDLRNLGLSADTETDGPCFSAQDREMPIFRPNRSVPALHMQTRDV